ncbi:hypothetical protein Efla_002603 [Eimeria flavescens]
MRLLLRSCARAVLGTLAAAALVASNKGVLSTETRQWQSPHLASTPRAHRYDGIRSRAPAAFASPAGPGLFRAAQEGLANDGVDDWNSPDHVDGEVSVLELFRQQTAPQEQPPMDAILQTVEIPLEVRKTTFKSDDIRALGLLLTTARTLISRATVRNVFLVLSAYYKIYSLFRACAAAYGLGFLFSTVDQVAGLAGLLVTTLTSLFLDSRKHNLYASLISGLRLPETTAKSLAGFFREGWSQPDAYRESTVLASIQNSMKLVSTDVLHPTPLGNLIDAALEPPIPSTRQMISFSTAQVNMEGFKARHPFVLVRARAETPLHVFTAELRREGSKYWNLVEALRSIALPILHEESTKKWDMIVNYHIYPLMEGIGVKAQEFALSLMQRYAFQLPDFLEWSDRGVDYRALIATSWDPLVGALSNWEAKEDVYTSQGLHWRDAPRMKQMYLLFLQQAQRTSFLRGDSKQPMLRPKVATCMSQFVSRLQAAGSPRLQAILDHVKLPEAFFTWELLNYCLLNLKDSKCETIPAYFSSLSGRTLTLSFSEEAIPVQFELRTQPKEKDIRVLHSFPKAVRPPRSAFGYAQSNQPAPSPKKSLLARIRDNLITRAKQLLSPFLTLARLARQVWKRFLRSLKKSHGPRITMKFSAFPSDPSYLILTMKYNGGNVTLVARPLHMLESIDPINCTARRAADVRQDKTDEAASNSEEEKALGGSLPGDEVKFSYPVDQLDTPTHQVLMHVLQSLLPDNIAREVMRSFHQGLAYHIWRPGGFSRTVELLQQWHLAKRLLRSTNAQAADLEITQNISDWRRRQRQDLEVLLRQKDSWFIIFNSADAEADASWDVVDAEAGAAEAVVKRYGEDFGELAALGLAAERELDSVSNADHVLSRMRSRLFDYSHLRTLYIESPGAFLQHLLEGGSSENVPYYDNWLLQRLQGNLANKVCRPNSFYGSAYAQYVALVDYYDKKDINASVPAVDKIKRFLLTASLPKGSLVRIRREDDSYHYGLYQLLERVDRCSFLLQDANGLQVATDIPLHIVLNFEDGDQVSHSLTQHQRFILTSKDKATGVCTIKDKKGYNFKLSPTDTTPITIGRFSHQDKRLLTGTWVLADPRSAYNTLLDLKPDYTVTFDVQRTIIQDCYSGPACVIKDERDLPIKVQHAMPNDDVYAWAGPWLWLFLNGLYSEYLSNVSNVQLVKSREDGFWIQRTTDELAQLCWYLEEEPGLSLERACLTPKPPSLLSRVLRRVRRKKEDPKVAPNRCSADFPEFHLYFPGAPTVEESTKTSTRNLFAEQSKQMVKCMSVAAHLLRQDRENSALFALRQHFRNRHCGGRISCPSWWLKAKELKAMVKRLSASGQRPVTPQHEWYNHVKMLSDTPLENYWIGRICSLEQSFKRLFDSLRLPQEKRSPCAEVTALVILASIMSEVTLLIRRRFLAKEEVRGHKMSQLLRYLETNEVPVPCSPSESQVKPDESDFAESVKADDCQSRNAEANAFLHMKAQVTAVHVQIDDVIQFIRAKFTPVFNSRASPGFISKEPHDFRRQAATLRAIQEEVSDLYAALYHPFEVWQGTFQQRQREEFLEMRMQQQCPFRNPQATQHAREVVPGARIPLTQGFLPFGYDDSDKAANMEERSTTRQNRTISLFTGLVLLQLMARGSAFANSVVEFVLSDLRFKKASSKTTWPLLQFLSEQSIAISSEPDVANALQCDALSNLRRGLLELGLQNEDVAIEAVCLQLFPMASADTSAPALARSTSCNLRCVAQVVQDFLKDVNFAEVATYLPPPVEGLDASAFPLGFLRPQSEPNSYSILVTPSGDVIFGAVPRPTLQAAGKESETRILVRLARDANGLQLEDPRTNTSFEFAKLKDCRPGSELYVEVLREAWKRIWADINAGSFWRNIFTSWKDAAKQYLDMIVEQKDPEGSCNRQKDFLVNEFVKVMGHNEKLRVGDYVRVADESKSLVYKLLQIEPISRKGCVSKLRQVESREIILSRSLLVRVPGFQRGDLVRKPSSMEVYEYRGTCGLYYELKSFVTGELDWTTEDLIPIWGNGRSDHLACCISSGRLEGANRYEDKAADLILFLKEFTRTEESEISRSDFRKALRLLRSHGRLTEDKMKKLQKMFDQRGNKPMFYREVGQLQGVARELMSTLEGELDFKHPPAPDKDLLHAWGTASLAALEAMWRSRHMWRSLHKLHQDVLVLFFAEVSNLAQRPDVLAAQDSLDMEGVRKRGRQAIMDFDPSSNTPLVLPPVSAAVPQRPAKQEVEDDTSAGWLSHFIDYVGESVLQPSTLQGTCLNDVETRRHDEALQSWEDYVTAVESRVQEFSIQQKALDEYRQELSSKDSAFPQNSLAAIWTDSVMLELSETIGKLMREQLGNKVSPETIKVVIRPVIFQELVKVSGLSFHNENDKDKVFARVSDFLAEEISKNYQIQNPGRKPRGDVLVDILSLLQVETHDLKMIEKRMLHQYHLLSQKYVDELLPGDLISIDGVLSMIGALESMLATLMTPLVDRAWGLVMKAAHIFSKKRQAEKHFLFAFDAMTAALDRAHSRETTPTLKKVSTFTPPMKVMGHLRRISTRFLTKSAAALSEAGFRMLNWFADTPFPDQLVNIPLIFWTPIRRGALNTGIQAALLSIAGPGSSARIKLVQDSIWVSGIEPWLTSMEAQKATLKRLIEEMEEGKKLSRDWWKELPLLIFIKQTLDDTRLSLFAPSTMQMIWKQIKFVTSASSGLYKVLMAPVQGMGAYLYTLLVELLNNVLPAENGEFLVPRDPNDNTREASATDIAVANPMDLVRYLHRLFDIVLKVYAPMLRELFDTVVQLVLQKIAKRVESSTGPLEFWRVVNQIAGYDLDGELEDDMRELIFKIGDNLVRLWPTMPLGKPGAWKHEQ